MARTAAHPQRPVTGYSAYWIDRLRLADDRPSALARAGSGRRAGVARLPSAIIEPRSRRPTDRFRIAPPPIRPASTATARAASRSAR